VQCLPWADSPEGADVDAGSNIIRFPDWNSMLPTSLAALVMTHAGWGGGPGWFLLIPLFWIVLLIVLFGVFARRWHRGDHPGGWQGPAVSAEATLAERFAQGDIDEVEYRARLAVLRANRPQRR
jgi:putative membrane protein